MRSSSDRADVQRYSRQYLSVGPEFGAAMRASHALVVGCGGLGAGIVPHLAMSGVAEITLVDDDVVEESNLHRQILFTEEDAALRRKKVHCSARFVALRNSSVRVNAVERRFTPEAADEILLASGSQMPHVVIDATDNKYSRYAINDACVRHGLPLVFGASIGTGGQVSVYNFDGGPCLRCARPDVDAGGDCRCAGAGVFGPVPALIGTLQATEALKVLAALHAPAGGRPPLAVSAEEVNYDAAGGAFYSVRRKRNADCSVCGAKRSSAPMPSGACAAPSLPEGSELGMAAFARAWRFAGAEVPAGEGGGLEVFSSAEGNAAALVMDVRNERLRGMHWLEGSVHLPLAELEGGSPRAERVLAALRRQESLEVFVLCRSGVDSVSATRLLHESGLPRAKNLRGGLAAWSREVEGQSPWT